MKGYRKALGEFIARTGKMVIPYFDLQSKARARRKQDLKDAIYRYCLAVISEEDLFYIGERRGAFDTPEYRKHLTRCRERQQQCRETIENLGGTIMDRTLYSIGHPGQSPEMIGDVIKKEFGDQVDCDCSTDMMVINYPHRLEGKLTLFMDEVYPEVQYEVDDLDDQFIAAGVFNFMEAERWLSENGYEVVHTDYSRYIQAPPLSAVRLAENLSEAVKLLERTGLTFEELMSELRSRMIENGFPRKKPDIEILLGEAEGDEEVTNDHGVTDKDLQRAALGIVLDAGYDDPKVLQRALVDANLAEEDKS